MESLKIFENPEFGTVRTMIDENGNPWFVGKDVAVILGYSNTRDALSKRVDDEDKKDGVAIRDSIGREQYPILINESGLYSLILSSKLPTAKKFKRWITSEVLPQIRKTGSYIPKDSYMIEDPIERAKVWIKEEEERRRLESENRELKPKADYFDALIGSKLNTNIRDTAKEFGLGQTQFVNFLIDKKMLYRDLKRSLKPYSYCIKSELFTIKEFKNYRNGKAGTQVLITPRGREAIRLLLEKQ